MKIHWIFRVVSLFNYQGSKQLKLPQSASPDCCAAFASDFIILAQLIFNVKHFFKVFSKSFLNCFKVVWIVLIFRSFATALLSYHMFCSLSTAFFQNYIFLNSDCNHFTFYTFFVESEFHSSMFVSFCQHPLSTKKSPKNIEKTLFFSML